MKLSERVEGSLSRVAAWARRPYAYAALLAGVMLVAIVVRIARVPSADDILSGHIDGKQYFVDAYGMHIHGFFEPFPHRANGWPLVLAGALRLFGFVGTSGFSMNMEVPWDQEGYQAIFFAYAFSAIVAAALVAATIILARQVTGPLAAAAAGALVAIDPFLLDQTTSVMADQIFAVLVVLAVACVLRARSNPAWLAAAGGLVALSHMARVNGLLILGTIVLFAAIYLRKESPRHRFWHLAFPIAAFALVAAPYLIWRAHYLPHAFDYGTNQRFWADDLWNMNDAYWASYSYATGGVRETAADYFATHTWGEAFLRLYHSGQWQLLDLTRVVLTPMLLVLGLTGMAATRKDSWAAITPILGLTLAGTYFWVYPLVRSPRYFLVLIPFFAILAAQGARMAAAATQRPTLAAFAILAPYFVTYAVEPLTLIGDVSRVLGDAHAGPMVIVFGTFLILAVALPIVAAPVLNRSRSALRTSAIQEGQ